MVGVERGLDIADAQLADVGGEVRIEGCGLDAGVVAVGAVDGMQHKRAVFDRAGDGADLVHGPDSAMAPVRGTRPKVGRRPVVPQRVEGEEMEPRVSVPMAKPTQPAATALAVPAEMPLEPCFGFHGLRVRAPGLPELRVPQRSPWASAPMVSLATRTAPAASRRLTTSASSSKV